MSLTRPRIFLSPPAATSAFEPLKLNLGDLLLQPPPAPLIALDGDLKLIADMFNSELFRQ